MDDNDESIMKDAQRWRWLQEHKAVIIECVTERRGFRNTMPNAAREVWYEHDGWIVSTMPSSSDPYPTMNEAVDAAMTWMSS